MVGMVWRWRGVDGWLGWEACRDATTLDFRKRWLSMNYKTERGNVDFFWLRFHAPVKILSDNQWVTKHPVAASRRWTLAGTWSLMMVIIAFIRLVRLLCWISIIKTRKCGACLFICSEALEKPMCGWINNTPHRICDIRGYDKTVMSVVALPAHVWNFPDFGTRISETLSLMLCCCILSSTTKL